MSDELVRRKALKELARRARAKTGAEAKFSPTQAELAAAAALESMLFPQQHACFFSLETRRRVGFCSRRAGKSFGACVKILATMLRNPQSLVVYIAQTKDMCRLYVWTELKKLVERFDLPFVFNETHLWLRHKRATGTCIFKGADDASELDKLRGPKWKLAIVDEAATFGAFIEELILEVLSPALRDEAGELIMIGTAGKYKKGLFYEVTTGLRDNWKVFEWDLTNNPHLPAEARDLKRISQEDGIPMDSAKFRREYLREWVEDFEQNIFRIDPEINVYRATSKFPEFLPKGHQWYTLLGVDFGWRDATAIVALAASRTDPRVYILETWAESEQLPDQVAKKLRYFKDKYKPVRVVGDVNGYGTAITEQLMRQYKLYVEPAVKKERNDFIEFMNNAYSNGNILIPEGSDLIQEYAKLSWNKARTDPAPHSIDNLSFAALYAWRTTLEYTQIAKKVTKEDPNSVDIDKQRIFERLSRGRTNSKSPWWSRR